MQFLFTYIHNPNHPKVKITNDMGTTDLFISQFLLSVVYVFRTFLAEEVKVVKVPKNLTEAGFREFLRAIYPQLERINFDLCKVNRHRVVVPLTECTPQAIRSSGVLGRSALYIRPEVRYR